MMMFMASDIVVGNALIALISTIFDSKISLIRLGEAQKTQRVDLQLEQELELERGQFCKQILYNNGPINGIQLSEVMNEKITQIDRCCQSVWQYIPSGIATALTWIITGQALRHEFVIIDTTNHTCCIELVKIKICELQQEEIQKLIFNIYGVQTQEQRKQQRIKILKNRHYDRVLGSIQLKHELYLSQINQLQNLLLICWKKMYEKKPMLSEWYEVFQKMSKQNARSIFYFSQEQPNYHVVLQSVVGIFTDKPFFITRIDMEICEKLIWCIGQDVSEDMRSSIKRFIDILQSIRERRDFSQSLIN